MRSPQDGVSKPDMMGRTAAIAILAATATAVCAAPGQAQDRYIVIPAPPTPDIVIVAPKDVKVVSVYPADGAEAPGGMVVVRIGFDQKMAADAWSYTKSDRGAFPNCLSRPRLLPDGKSFALLCSLSPNTAYAFDVNAVPAFETTAGRKPRLYSVSFKTTAEINVGLHAALAAAGLTDADDPIMNEVYTPGAVTSPPRSAEIGAGAPPGR